MVSSSLIVSAYNQAGALSLLFEALAAQTVPVDEVVVADDGSSDDTAAVVTREAALGRIPLRALVRQADRGFRKSTALNRAVLNTTGQQLLFLDGDVLPAPDWCAVHRYFYRPSRYGVGEYRFVPLSVTEQLTPANTAVQLAALAHECGDRRRLLGQHLKTCWYRVLRKRSRPRLLGGNFSVGRALFAGVNGFDERYNGFGGEDSDLRYRMNCHGGVPVSLILRAQVFHLDRRALVSGANISTPNRRPTAESPYHKDDKDRVCAQQGLNERMTDTPVIQTFEHSCRIVEY